MKDANDALRFVLELCALGAIAYWGWRRGRSVAMRWALALGGVVAVVAVWAIFHSESDAVVEVSTAVRIVIEVVIFAAATAALVAVRQTVLAVIFAVLATLNEVLNYTLD
jgi:Protein of unknown function (DUF2568)